MIRTIFDRSRVLVATASIVIGLLAIQFINVSPAYSFLGSNREGLAAPAGSTEGETANERVSEADKERFREIEALLQAIPTGREALRSKEEYRVRLEFRPEEGTYYNWSTNTMVIDPNKDSVKAAFLLVHEMTHASRYHQGFSAHLGELSRQAYVQNRLEEEAEGMVRSFKAKQEMEAIGISVPVIASALEDQFMKAYNAAITSSTIEMIGTSEEEKMVIARAAGKQAVIESFYDGKAVTSNERRTYPKMYGEFWDQVVQPIQNKIAQ